MIRPSMEIVRFDAKDVIATSVIPVRPIINDIYMTNNSIVNYNNYSKNDVDIAMVNTQEYSWDSDVYQVFRLIQIADGYIASRTDHAPTITMNEGDGATYKTIFNWLQTGILKQ